MSPVQVGDEVARRPVTLTGLDTKQTLRMRGQVVWVHPAGRFHVVEFETPGGPLRESFMERAEGV